VFCVATGFLLTSQWESLCLTTLPCVSPSRPPPPQAREVQQFTTLVGYGADAICPYLAYEALFALHETGEAGPGEGASGSGG
jgi:hypothetical protein